MAVMRTRFGRLCLAGLAVVGPLVLIGGATSAEPAGAASPSSGPQCTFNGSSLPLLQGGSAGEKIVVSCTGLPPLHPYLMMETSLLLGIDPKAAPLLEGDITSVSGLMALLSALPEINPAALDFPLSNLSGDLNYTYTLPSSQAPDPNATCGPSTLEINEGLIGCGLATIDLTTFKTVAAGSALIEYAGDPFLPPDPKLGLSTHSATPGQVVDVSALPNATTFWWLSTLSALGALLGDGASAPPTVTVTLSKRATSTTLPNTVAVTPAVYNYPVLTPPTISGGFTVPTGVKGSQSVTVTYQADLLSFGLANSASSHLTVKK
jgi:hypothetical protein